MVRGIAGGNPTGMRVTGGFLANAQKFQGGDTVSAYFNPKDWRPGQYKAESQRQITNLGDRILNEIYGGNTYLLGIAKENKHGEIEKISSQLGVPILDVKRALGHHQVTDPEKYTEDTVVSPSGETVIAGKVKGEPILSSLEQQELGANAPEGWNLGEETKLMKAGKHNELHPYTKALIDSGQIPSAVEEEQEPKGYPGSRLEQRKFHTGPFAKTEQEIWEEENLIPIDEIGTLYNEKEQKIINKAKKNNESSIVSTINNAAGSDDAFSDQKDTVKNLQDDLKKVMDGRKKVSEKDSSELNKLIKNMYGGEGKEDAPAWALPLMVAGFTMAASDNPDMLGAAAEGGIAGVDTYIKTKDKKDQKMKDQLDAYLKLEDIDIRKEQMDLSNEQFYTGLEVNTNATIAQLEATISNQNLDRKLAYEQMYQTWEIHESELMYKYDALEWDKLSETMKMKHNALLANAQILKLHAEAEALGLKKPTYDTFNIDGEDVRVAITQKADGSYDIIEIGQPSSASTVLKAFMETFGTTITQKIQDDEFDSNEWTILYDEFKKMVSGENKISEEDKNYKKIETN
jgi:hypothetical protein